jgi:intracellular sulfur oxidation DsrE/DsrF family protein
MSRHFFRPEPEMRSPVILLALAALPAIASADLSSFTTGPAIEDYGPVTDVDVTLPVPDDAVFQHVFDVASQAEDGEPNRTLVSAARFINMHTRAGTEAENINLAIVVHGAAVHDVSGEDSSSADLVATLLDHGVRFIVCGQSAAYYNVMTEDLLPGVEMALSAMTAHALLQQQGYTLNPF